jgi:hypothetical protein
MTAGCGISNRSNNRELLTRGGPSTARERLKLTTLHRIKTACYDLLHKASDMDGFFEMVW